MILKVCFINPVPSGSNYVEFDDVATWRSEHAELHITRSSGDRVTFAARQWVWVEETKLNGRDRDHRGQDVDSTRDNNMKAQVAAREDALKMVERLDRQRDQRQHDGRRRKSDLSDLAYTAPEDVERMNAASVQFAIDNRTVPWSEAHMRQLLEYERMVADEHGPDAVRALPWNQVRRASDGTYK